MTAALATIGHNSEPMPFRQSREEIEGLFAEASNWLDGSGVTTDADALSKISVSAEVVDELRGPKIVIQKYKNKTGYKKRQGHRQDLTRLKITNIK